MTNNEQLPHVLPHHHHVPCCNAMSKRTKQLCRQPAMKNGKCRFHGGKSTSAKTALGKMKRDQANLKHGFYTKEAKETRQAMNMVLNELRALY